MLTNLLYRISVYFFPLHFILLESLAICLLVSFWIPIWSWKVFLCLEIFWKSSLFLYLVSLLVSCNSSLKLFVKNPPCDLYLSWLWFLYLAIFIIYYDILFALFYFLVFCNLFSYSSLTTLISFYSSSGSLIMNFSPNVGFQNVYIVYTYDNILEINWFCFVLLLLDLKLAHDYFIMYSTISPWPCFYC